MAFVQKGTLINQGSSSTTMTPAIAGVTAGNLLVATVNYGSLSASDPMPAAPTGWLRAASCPVSSSHGYSQYTAVYYKENAAAGSHTLPLTGLASDTQGNGIIAEFSGYATSSSLDVSASNTGTYGVGSDATSGSISTAAATAQANELAIVIFAWDDSNGVSNIGLTNPSGWNNLFLVVNSSSFNPAVAAYKELTSTGTQTVSETGLTGGWGSATIVAFKAAGGAGTNTLTGANSTEAATSGTGAITVSHQMVGANSSQADLASTGAITQVHSLSGASSTQSDTSSTGSLNAAITLTGSDSSQAGSTTTGSLVQTHIPVGASSTQSNTSSAGAITQVHALSGANCIQSETSGTGALSIASNTVSIVSFVPNKQFWQSGTDWSAKNVTVSQAGDAILTFGLFYAAGTLGQKYPPTDNNGTFVQGVDPGRPDPGSYPGYPQPVTSCIYYQLNAAVATHSITPPNIGPNVNDDGNMWSVVVRGLPVSGSPRATGHFHQVSNSAGTTFSSVTVSLSSACQVGDAVFAILGYDDDRVFGTVTFTEPSGWTRIDWDTDANTSCPCALYWKIATAADTETVTLSWNDPHGTVTDASILAFAPAVPSNTLTGAASTQSSSSSAAAITQVHALAGAASSESAASSAGAIAQIHVLSGSNSAQSSSSTPSALAQTHVLAAASSTQADSSSTGAIDQVHVLAGASSSESTVSSSASIAQTHSLSGANSTQNSSSNNGSVTIGALITGTPAVQSSSSSTGAITQTHVLAASSSAQSSSAGTGAITQVHALAGASSSQSDTSGIGAIALATQLTGSASSQLNSSGTGAILVSQNLTGANSVQGDQSSTGQISQNLPPGSLVGADSTQKAFSGTGSISQIVMLGGADSHQSNLSPGGRITLSTGVHAAPSRTFKTNPSRIIW